MSRTRLTAVVCTAEIVGMAGFATFPALVPGFRDLWDLSNTQVGWISGVYYLGYVVGVPVLTAWTDRVDARRIVLAFTLVGGVSSLAFAVLADGFVSALVLRFFAGLALAGTYMPGLRLLSDRAEGAVQSRMVALYTASFSAGASLSYLLAGEIDALFGWRWVFGLAASGALVAWILVVGWVPSAPEGAPRGRTAPVSRVLDVRPVFRHRPAMAYVLGYAAHMWELFALRAWIVAFLAWCFAVPGGTGAWSATRVAALVNLIGMPSSILGNELSVRFGRRRTIATVMVLSAMTAIAVGLLGPRSPLLAVAFAVLYGALVMGDSSSLTAGAVAAAPQGRRGATLAVHSTLGFGAAFAGPLAVGVALDRFVDPAVGWIVAFAVLGVANLFGVGVLASFRDAGAGPGLSGGRAFP
jgi:MFS family permease